MTSKLKVFVTRNDIPDTMLHTVGQSFEVDEFTEDRAIPRAELLSRVAGVSGILCKSGDRIDKELLDAAGPSLKVVSTMSVGYDHIDLEEVKRRGIQVGFTPDVLTDATAELTVALLLATSRCLFQANAELKNGGWQNSCWTTQWMLGRGLAGSTVGIFGLGRIGQAVMKRMAGFNVDRFLYTSNSVKQLDDSYPSAQFVSFEALLQQSDFVVCTAAFNDATRNKFNRAAFSAMKKTATFVNVSRGGLVDQDALVWALQSGEIWAAGLDVMTPEPLPTNHVLTTLSNCTLLPHIGSGEVRTRTAMAQLAVDNLIAGLTPGTKMKKQLC